jgi:hypothetical protein
MTRTGNYATLNDARIALRQWKAAHMDESKNYSKNPFEDTLRSYLHSLEPGEEMDALESAWDWAQSGFQGDPPQL